MFDKATFVVDREQIVLHTLQYLLYICVGTVCCACTKRKFFLYYCKIIMLVVQNVFLNVINKYRYLPRPNRGTII